MKNSHAPKDNTNLCGPYYMHLFVLWDVLWAGELEKLKGQASFLSRCPVMSCHLSFLCSSYAVSSLSSTVASPLWSTLCLLSVKHMCKKNRLMKTYNTIPQYITVTYYHISKLTFARSMSSFLSGPSVK